NSDGDAAVGFIGKAFGRALIDFVPVLAAVGGFEDSAARTAGTEGPSLAAEVPSSRIKCVGILRCHRNHAAAGGRIGSRQHLAPVLAAVGGLVNAAGLIVGKGAAGSAYPDGVAVFRTDQDLGNVLRIFESNVVPVFAAVGGFVHAVANGHAVAHPALTAAYPNVLRVCRIDGNGANRLHVGLIEDRFEAAASIHRLPHAAAGRSGKDGQASVIVERSHGSDASAHRGRADVARGQPGDGAGVKLH